MYLYEQLTLLLLNPKKGHVDRSFGGPDVAVCGSMIMDVADCGRAELRDGRLVPCAGDPLDDPFLQEVLTTIAEKPRRVRQVMAKAQDRIGGLFGSVTRPVLEDMTKKGYISHEHTSIFGRAHRRYLPDPDERAAIVADVMRAARGDAAATHDGDRLLLMLQASDAMKLAFPEQKDRRKAKAAIAAQQKKAGELTGTITRVVDETHAAVIGAIAAGGAAGAH